MERIVHGPARSARCANNRSLTVAARTGSAVAARMRSAVAARMRSAVAARMRSAVAARMRSAVAARMRSAVAARPGRDGALWRRVSSWLAVMACSLPACRAQPGPVESAPPNRPVHAAPAAVSPPPGFAVRMADGRFLAFAAPAGDVADYGIDGPAVRALVRLDDGHPGHWVLTLTAGEVGVEQVQFPWDAERHGLDDSPDDDVIYYPYLLGVAVRSAATGEFAWEGMSYPGPLFAPLVVAADDDDARIVAAANWPPRRVDVHYSLDRLTVRYAEPLAPRATRDYRAIAARVRGDAARGEPPWQLALDLYKRWLDERLREAGLSSRAVPDELQSAHGWINVQLENEPRFDPDRVLRLWERWKSRFPWVQFWGQMSNYAGPAHLADPPLRRGEPVGCCLDRQELHPRYRAGLPRVVQRIRGDGGRVGFYTRPRDPYRRLDDPADPRGDRAFLLEWVSRNAAELGANACYVDVLGAGDFGDALAVADLVRRSLPALTVIERTVDVYPAAALVSGCLTGGDWNGGPGRAPPAAARTTFPRFGRYLLDDRVIFLGQSNDDGRYWGAAHDHWTERQAFLLGAKLDAQNLAEGDPVRGPDNPALVRIVELRERTRWWQRRPIYLDRRGVRDVPAGVDVRRFRGRAGEDLLAIDNWRQVRGARFRLGDEVIDVPADALAIIVRRGPSRQP